MADVLLFHHVYGLTEGVSAFADRLREAGHTVTVPDLFEGGSSASTHPGGPPGNIGALGIEGFLAAATAAADARTGPHVYAGFSLGALAAHMLAQSRPDARGALLYHHGDVPLDTFGEAWPDGVPVQIHVGDDDEMHDPDCVAAFVDGVAGHASVESFVYPDAGHLFTDSTMPEYDEAATDLVIERTLAFLARLG